MHENFDAKRRIPASDRQFQVRQLPETAGTAQGGEKEYIIKANFSGSRAHIINISVSLDPESRRYS